MNPAWHRGFPALPARQLVARPCRTITLWLSLLIGLAVAGYLASPPVEQRTLFSDQATHIAASLSIWHDHNLEYTLGDLDRFRQTMPAEPGPQGAFLKVGPDGRLYYAKPFLYAAFASPFVGAFGLNGFLIFNVVCLAAIGIVAIKALGPQFGQLNGLLLTCGLLLLSPFIAWTPIAHPDLFIAALVVLGGFLLLKPESLLACKIVGAILLGLVLYEKPTFVFLVVPMLIALFRAVPLRNLALLALLTGLAWAAFSTVNFLQDGHATAYKGLRFYVKGTPGTFPLESGWYGPPTRGGTDHVFDSSNILSGITANLPLLPSKFADALIGRQTGLLLYFSVALLLLGLALRRTSWRGAVVLGGLLAYLLFNWLLFPTNGYGGGGSYGPRYTMQAIGVMLLAFVLPLRTGSAKPIPSSKITWVIGATLAVAVVLQFRVIPPRPNLVQYPHSLLSPIATLFPIESSLTPFVSHALGPAFRRADGRGNYIYMVDGKGEGFQLDFGADSTGQDIVLFQNKDSVMWELPFPLVGVMVTRAVELEFVAGGEVIGRATAYPGAAQWVTLRSPFRSPFHDALIGPFKLQRLTVRARPFGDAHSSVPTRVDFCLGDPGAEHGHFGIESDPTLRRFAERGVTLPVGWQVPEEWGVWSMGEYAALAVKAPAAGRALELFFGIHAFTPAQAPTLDVDVTANGAFLETWSFPDGESPPSRRLRIPPELVGTRGEVIVGFGIRNPRSAISLGIGSDPREIGLALADVRVSSIENAPMKPARSLKNGVTLLEGWQSSEEWGVWSDGAKAVLGIQTPGSGRTLQLAFNVRAFTPEKAETLNVDVAVNGTFVETWSFRHGEVAPAPTLQIPSGLVGNDRAVRVEFGIRAPRSPASVGLSSDPREIGLGLADVQWSWVE